VAAQPGEPEGGVVRPGARAWTATLADGTKRGIRRAPAAGETRSASDGTQLWYPPSWDAGAQGVADSWRS